MVSQNTSSYNNVYRFSGKELDEETGLSYFGARYYNPKWSVWLSVDPEFAKFPNWTPYRYCFNNPLRYTDPNGMLENDDVIITNNEGHVLKVIPDDKENVVYQYNEDKTELTKVDNLKQETKNAEGIKRSDIIKDGELFRIVPNVKILRKDIDVNGEDKYGHWWVEIGKSESYGWWPKNPVGYTDTVTGVQGELNGQTSFGGTSTRDPHHGDRSEGVNFFNVYTQNAASTSGIDNSIRNFSKNYSGNWSWPLGQNCHSFQESFMEKLNLTINP